MPPTVVLDDLGSFDDLVCLERGIRAGKAGLDRWHDLFGS